MTRRHRVAGFRDPVSRDPVNGVPANRVPVAHDA